MPPEKPSSDEDSTATSAESLAPDAVALPGAPAGPSQSEMFQNRLRKNWKPLKKWSERERITCFRVYDHDIPEVPLAVDVYDGRLHLAEYVRPTSPYGDAHGPWVEGLAHAAAVALGVPEDGVFLKRRQRQSGTAQYERFAAVGATAVVTEGGRRFRVNLSDYLDTGLFLDHRRTRGHVAAVSQGARVLNLFAYTGSFTVYAATAGAAATTTVDWSNTYLDWARDNLSLNGIDGGPHRFIRDDATTFAELDRGTYDVIVVDPPTFSNRTDRAMFDVQRDHERLIAACLRRLSPGGTMVFSTNFRRFKPGPVLETFTEVSEKTVPFDFRDRRIHRCFWLGPGRP